MGRNPIASAHNFFGIQDWREPVKKIDFEITNPDDLEIDDKGQIGLF